MNIHDYLIDQQGFDWSELLSTWHWLLPRQFTVWLVNRFGDLFIIKDDGTVHMLDVGVGSLKQVASSKDEFWEKIDEPGRAGDWLAIPLVDALVASGQTLGSGQCYSYRQLPVLGGDYEIGNVIIKDIAFHYAAFGPIHERIKNLPDGTKVTFKVEG